MIKQIKYQNTQLWNECQLISIWNAGRFFGKRPPPIGTEEYRKACEKACAINGGAIFTKTEFRRMGIKKRKGKFDFKWIRKHLPVEFSVFHPTKGFHSVLGVKVKNGKILLANYSSGRLMWMTWNQLIMRSLWKYKPHEYKIYE